MWYTSVKGALYQLDHYWEHKKLWKCFMVMKNIKYKGQFKLLSFTLGQNKKEYKCQHIFFRQNPYKK